MNTTTQDMRGALSGGRSRLWSAGFLLAALGAPALGASPLAPIATASEGALTIDSTVADVTVYGDSAILTRTANLPTSQGSFLIEGLPAVMDPSSIRVRAAGGEVVGVDTRIRYTTQATDERVLELEKLVRNAQRREDHASDAYTTADELVRYYDALLSQERDLFERGLAKGAADMERWEEGMTFFETELKNVRDKRREAKWNLEDAQAATKAAQVEFSSARIPGGAYTYDLEVDLVSNGAASSLEVEYLVSRAGWTPVYDLRADEELESVELVYRAKVQQSTGEDWDDVALLLSTARPELGASGPELEMTWASVYDPDDLIMDRVGVTASPKADVMFESLGYLGEEQEDSGLMAWAPSFAGVMDSGISARFQLPSRETVESREEPSTLLVGRAYLDVDVEHFAVPALSERVWLRGKSENTSPWVLLPGEASVYFGSDFIGHSRIDNVLVGGEFDLHLGADPGMALERTLIEDLSKGPKFLRSNKSVTEAWRVHLTNHGASAANRDGSVQVIVQEVLPASTDERLEVVIDESSPAVSSAERWQRDREERGILTWVLTVPADGEADLTWSRKLTYPKDTEVVGEN